MCAGPCRTATVPVKQNGYEPVRIATAQWMCLRFVNEPRQIVRSLRNARESIAQSDDLLLPRNYSGCIMLQDEEHADSVTPSDRINDTRSNQGNLKNGVYLGTT
jgi:hypothetical protein